MSEFERITSRDNNTLKLAAALQTSSKKRYESGLFVLEGLRLCEDAVNNGYPIEFFIVSDSALNRFKEHAEKISALYSHSYVVSDSLFLKISDTKNPQGFLCACKLIPSLKTLKSDGKYVALENLSDPSNIGAISRTAEALGFDGIIITSDSCDPYAPKSLRASMGALVRIPLMVVEDIIATAENYGLNTYSAVVGRDALPVNKAEFTKGSIVIIGNEANGIKEDTIIKSTKLITIPMSGKAESLNAAAAASIIMWEMCK